MKPETLAVSSFLDYAINSGQAKERMSIVKKVCFIGACGHFGSAVSVISERPEDFSIVGISAGSEGVDIEKLEKTIVGKGLPVPKRYENYQEMLLSEKPDIAVVDGYFCDHAKMAAFALRQGIHVYCEKPVATTLEDLEMLKAAYQEAAAKGVHFSYMLTTRYDPWCYTAHKAVEAGAIGEIRMLNGQKSYKAGKRGTLFHKRETYGGTIPWVGIHAIDWVLWFSGKKVERITAIQSTKANGGNGSMEATAICLFQMEDEVVAHVNIDYLRPQSAPTHGDDRIRIAGTKGVIEAHGSDGKVYLINDEGARKLELLTPPRIFADFVAEIEGKGEQTITAEESFYGTEICLKAQLAADTGKTIEV